MKPLDIYLKQLHAARPKFKATKHVNRIIGDELRNIRQQSVFDYYHDYVSKYGYPIPAKSKLKSCYVSRPELESKLSRYIRSKKDIILLGCEGSGKTTMLHRVASDITESNSGRFLYIDANDIEGVQNVRNEPVVFLKLAKAIANLSKTEVGKEYVEWFSACQNVQFLKPLIKNDTALNQVESFFTFIRTQNHKWITHVIIDNIDSVSVDVCEGIFSSLKSIDDTVRATANVLEEKDYNNIRYIISCRTATYRHINGTTRGLFLNRPHQLIAVEDDFLANTNIIEILERFLLNPNGEVYQHASKEMIPIIAKDFSYTTTMTSYFADVLSWLKNAENSTGGVVNKTIKMFSGRSIRRAKLYGLKVFANPLISRLALFENQKTVGITKHDKLYLKRRVLEAIFDFRKGKGAGLLGFPLNPYNVLDDWTEFKNNPLIGVIAIFFLYDNSTELKMKKVYFANVISITPLLELLKNIGYSEAAINDVFSNLRHSGVLRPIPSSDILQHSALDSKNVHEEYIIDNNALDNIYGLMVGRDLETSIIFYNCALRSRYNLGHLRLVDNWLSECFLTLVFLKGFYEREKHLEEILKSKNVKLAAPSERFAGKALTRCAQVFNSFEKSRYERKNTQTRNLNDELYDQTEHLIHVVQELARETSSILG